jgi:acetyl-CoA carboxylase biotin carboxylase subunit
MLKKVLIANRGEIAVRIIRACKELGIRTVAIYSEADKEALHTRLADEAYCVGPAVSKRSYLNEKNILEVAYHTGIDSIHPGFGFLSENANFAKMCTECNIKFIGPTYETIEMMGNKANSKALMKKAGVPVIPGSDGVVNDYIEALKVASEIGYPVILKASLGGGGKGIRIVYSETDMKQLFELVKQESVNAFKSGDIYMEKYIQNPRHVEVQILADSHGNVMHLGERDCSIQRKNQKIIEETPSPILDSKIRSKMYKAAIDVAKVSKYEGAGTIEFLVDGHDFYFMEMNTRIQVEHPVTEMITGVDIVKEQLRVASGETLSKKQSDIKLNGHSMECRINAEMPEKNFMPCPGTIKELHFPGGNGVRIDSAVYSGYTIPSCYDSMIAKLIVHSESREESINKMITALEECVIDGIHTNIEFLLKILKNEDYRKNNYDTSFIEKKFM